VGTQWEVAFSLRCSQSLPSQGTLGFVPRIRSITWTIPWGFLKASPISFNPPGSSEQVSFLPFYRGGKSSSKNLRTSEKTQEAKKVREQAPSPIQPFQTTRCKANTNSQLCTNNSKVC
jgi:hypothetical protein